MENTTKVSARKRAAAVVAVVLAVAIALGGTYAWQSFGEEAQNSAQGQTGSAGGRLHDDYEVVGANNGRSEWRVNRMANKDIYVENYQSVADGHDIFVRLKLYEYMEEGEGAILPVSDPGYAARAVTPLVSGSNRDNTDTWTPRIPGADPAGSDLFKSKWEWTMGGTKSYMPTFNKDNRSQETDVKGDAVNMGALGSGEAKNATIAGEANAYDPDAGLHDFFETQNSHDSPEKYWDDSAGVHSMDATVSTHTAKTTKTATILTMAEWKAAPYNDQPGDYWVLDADGWCYWASPLVPQSATGLLVDNLILRADPAENWYYSVYIKSEMATAIDWMSGADGQGFYGDAAQAPSNDAEDLLHLITGHIPDATGVTISGSGLVNNMAAPSIGSTLNLSADVDAVYTNDSSWDAVVWTIDPATTDASFSNGVFTPNVADAGKWYTIRATAAKDTDAFGECRVYVPPAGKSAVTGLDGNYYVYTIANDDNTYTKVNTDGTLGSLVCPTMAGQPGAATDRTVVNGYSGHYLVDGDRYYYGAGSDGKLGVGGDDVLLYDDGSGALISISIRLGATTYTDSNGVVWRILKDNRRASGTLTNFVTENGSAEISDGSGTVLLVTDRVYGTGGLSNFGRGYTYNGTSTNTGSTWSQYASASIKSAFDSWYSANVSATLKATACLPNVKYESATAPDNSWSETYNLDAGISAALGKAGATMTGVVFPLSVSEISRYIGTTDALRISNDVADVAQFWWARSAGGGYAQYGTHIRSNGSIYGYYGVYPELAIRPAMWIDTTP